MQSFLLVHVAVGCEVDNERMELLLSQLSGKDITELIAAGREKFASVPCGGGGVAVAAGAPAAGGAAPAAEAKKEEKVEEKEESDDVRSLFSNSGCTFSPYQNSSNKVLCSGIINILLSIHLDINGHIFFYTVVSFAVDNIQRLYHVHYLLCRIWASASSTRLHSHHSIVSGSEIKGKPESCLDFNLILCWKVLQRLLIVSVFGNSAVDCYDGWDLLVNQSFSILYPELVIPKFSGFLTILLLHVDIALFILIHLLWLFAITKSLDGGQPRIIKLILMGHKILWNLLFKKINYAQIL
jgi:ribosomal protein L12E/L44/L45/RPP1/RPP2